MEASDRNLGLLADDELDLFQTFSPVDKLVTIHSVLKQFNGNLNEKIYMKQCEEFEHSIMSVFWGRVFTDLNNF